MRRYLWMVALMALAGCSRAGDPVVGKWMDARSHSLLMELRADGTVVHDMDFSSALAKLAAKYPLRKEQYRARLDKSRESLRSQKAAWARKRGLYRVTTHTSFREEPVVSHYRLEGKELALCKEDGTPLGPRWVRQTQ